MVDALGLAAASDLQKKIWEKSSEIHCDLSARTIDKKNAENTLLRSMHHLEELAPHDSSSTPKNVPELHLVLAIDSVLPNPYPTPVTTALFSQLHTIWARRYSQEAKTGDRDEVPKYFRENDADATAFALDNLLASSLKTCLEQLSKNHEQFCDNIDYDFIEFPRVIRLLFGTPESLIQTAEDFNEFPESAFPLMSNNGHKDRVLNLWIRRTIGRELFSVAIVGGTGDSRFTQFESNCGKLIPDVPGQKTYNHLN